MVDTDMSAQEILADAQHKMDVAVQMTQESLAGIRTGRANPQILHGLTVEYYGTQTPLQQLASFSVPEPRMLVVNPFDKSASDEIEKAIRDSDLGLNPSTDGAIIRCVFPELTEDRRKEFIRMARQRAEEGRIAVRNVRRPAKDALQELEDEGDIGADEHDRYAKQLESFTSDHVNRIDKMLESKEEDLLEV